MSEKKKEEDPWETGLKLVAGVGAAAVAIGGFAYLISKASEESETSENPAEVRSLSYPRATCEHRPRAVRSLPYYTTKTAEPSDEQEKCVVCWGTMKIKRLSCGHVFHPQCISTWLAKKSTCPLCRAEQ